VTKIAIKLSEQVDKYLIEEDKLCVAGGF